MSEIRLGIIGAGYIAKEHLNVIQAMDSVRAVGITSRTLSKADQLAKTFQIENVYKTIDNMLNYCSLDAVMVLVSANQVYDVALNLLPIGIPLFLEKPPGLFPEQTKLLVELANKHETKNMVGYNRRFYSIFHEGLKIINQKGNVVGVAVEVYGKEAGIESFNFGVKSSTLKTFASSNQFKFQDPSTEELSNKELGQLITEATIYLECWMSVAKIKLIIEEGERQKAFFSEYK